MIELHCENQWRWTTVEVKLDSILSYEKINTDADAVFLAVEKNGKVVLLKDNQPAYLIVKYEANMSEIENREKSVASSYKLQEAMKMVLSDAEGNMMHAAALADEIYRRKLYLQKDGTKAKYNQMRARCSHYPDLFEALPGNIIKLK